MKNIEEICLEKYEKYFVFRENTEKRFDLIKKFYSSKLFKEYLDVFGFSRSEIKKVKQDIEDALIGDFLVRVSTIPFTKQVDGQFTLDYVAFIMITPTRFIYFTLGTSYSKFHEYVISEIETIKVKKFYRQNNGGLEITLAGAGDLLNVYFSENIAQRTLKILQELRVLTYLNKNIERIKVLYENEKI